MGVFWWGQAGQHKALLYLAPAGLRVLCALAEEQGRMWPGGGERAKGRRHLLPCTSRLPAARLLARASGDGGLGAEAGLKGTSCLVCGEEGFL